MNSNSASRTPPNLGPTENAVLALLHTHRYILRPRIHGLLYYLDHLHTTHSGEQYTDATFEVYMYGTYWGDIDTTLNKLEEMGCIDITHDIFKGHIVERYQLTETIPDIPPSILDLADEVTDATKSFSTPELQEWTKDTQPYKQGEYGAEVRWNTLTNEDHL